MSKKDGKSFKQKLGTKELAFFNQVSKKPFSEQATCFLNAYWNEVGDQAEFIFNVSWEYFKGADMHFKGVELIHLYEEGINLDFDAGLYFFEQICKYCDDEKNDYVADDQYKVSLPKMMTAIVRKKELKNKVDVNFDGRVSYIEYLLYQYQDCGCNPADFCQKAMAIGDENQYIRAARLALAEVAKAIQEYERYKAKLEKDSKKPGVKGLTAKNQLAQLECSPLAEDLSTRLIKAEAALRIVKKKYRSKNTKGQTPGGTTLAPQDGAIWWMDKDLANKKKKYGKKKKEMMLFGEKEKRKIRCISIGKKQKGSANG